MAVFSGAALIVVTKIHAHHSLNRQIVQFRQTQNKQFHKQRHREVTASLFCFGLHPLPLTWQETLQ